MSNPVRERLLKACGIASAFAMIDPEKDNSPEMLKAIKETALQLYNELTDIVKLIPRDQ
jgi:hypothetical protein